MGAPVAWFDFTSKDPGRIGEFCAELFGWSLADLQLSLDRAVTLGGSLVAPPDTTGW